MDARSLDCPVEKGDPSRAARVDTPLRFVDYVMVTISLRSGSRYGIPRAEVMNRKDGYPSYRSRGGEHGLPGLGTLISHI